MRKIMDSLCAATISAVLLSPVCTGAATVQPIFTNDTVANTLSFNDTFGHTVPIGTYDPVTGLWTSTGSIGGFTNLTVSGNATIAGTTGLTGQTTVGALTATGLVNGSGFTSLFASPPPIGSTSANTGAFTTLSATGALSGAGFNSLITAPPLGIGSVTPNGGAFTTLSASGVVSGTGFANYLLSPPAIGNTAPNTGKFTTFEATGAGLFDTTLTVTGLTTLNGAVNINGSAGTQPTVWAINTGGGASQAVPGFFFQESEGYASFSSSTTHFGFVSQNTKNVAGANSTGSRQAGTIQQLGVGGTVNDFFTGGFELAEPCLSPVTCNAFNLSGNFTGNSPWAFIPAGMTPTTVTGEEIDNTLLSTGAAEREGLRIVDITSTQHGTIDAAINVAATGVGWNTGIYWGDNTATFGLASGGTFLDTPAIGSVTLNTFMNFANITASPTLAGILLPQQSTAGIGFGSHGACCAGGEIQSSTSAGGGAILFANAITDFAFATVNSVFIEPNGQVLHIPQTIATLPTCNAGQKGSETFVSDTVSANAMAFHAVVAGAGGNTINTLVTCNGTNWIMD